MCLPHLGGISGDCAGVVSEHTWLNACCLCFHSASPHIHEHVEEHDRQRTPLNDAIGAGAIWSHVTTQPESFAKLLVHALQRVQHQWREALSLSQCENDLKRHSVKALAPVK